MVKRIEELAIKVKGVEKCHNIRTRKLGHYYMIDLGIQVDQNLVKK